MAERSLHAAEDWFWAHVDVPDDPQSCWRWRGPINGNGYGQLSIYLGKGKQWRPMAHRVSYELNVGLIPAGLVIDHLCRNRWCVNPRHLEPVTQAENVRRGEKDEGRRRAFAQRTHCSRGHELTPDNRYGYGRCWTCNRATRRAAARRLPARQVTEPCGVVSYKGNPCQRQKGHDGKHSGQRFAHKLQAS